ncbi:hypothetical protein [Phyllobacterium myrsinacearum]|uniref:Uncharacterized protein n=1 Tax=Phyllobacterium myrsinacearum TaxID=28101 RepID=A0A839ECY7_9HYPH|nr:hypothetical protein [Phyllobacterium myrsinacearum]MBA8877873.1 hypothetical protein [Phyllobacterium myrsinacearum]
MAELILRHGDTALAAMELNATFNARRQLKLKPQPKNAANTGKPVVAKKKHPEPSPAQARRDEAKLNELLGKVDAGNHSATSPHKVTIMKTLSKEQTQSAWKKALKREGHSDVAPSGSAPTASATGGRSKLSADQIKACWKKAVAQ